MKNVTTIHRAMLIFTVAFVPSGVGWAQSGGDDKPAPVFRPRPIAPVIKLWAAPGELRIDPLTGKAHNVSVRKRDWRKGSSVWSAGESKVTLAGARNEYLGFQLIVEAGGDNLRYVKVAASDLVGAAGRKIAARNIKLFRVWYTEVTEPSHMFRSGGFNAMGLPSMGAGLYGDALIPFGLRFWGNNFAVVRSRNQAVWVDVRIPKDARAGTYKGKLTVKADRAKSSAVDVELTVWDLTIPDKLSARAEAPIYRATIPGMWRISPRSDLALKLEKQYFRLARKHRMIGYIYDCFPDIKGEGLDIEVDWTFHDKRFAAILDGSAFDDKIPIEHFNVPVDTYWPSPKNMVTEDPKTYYGRLEKVLKAYDKHFAEKGWSPRMYVFFQGLDEPSEEWKFKRLEALADVVHRSSKRIKFRHDFYTAFASPDKLLKRFADSMDIWCISGCFYPVDKLQAQQARGKEAWFYQGSEPWIGSENLDSEALGLRTWAWIAWKYRVDCWHNWCAGRWGGENLLVYPNNSGTRQAWRPNHNGVMMFPGKILGVDEIFPSIRLKAYRRGNTDYEYMVMLKALGAGDKADEIVNSVVRKALGEAGNDRMKIGARGDWSHDPDDWAAARVKLAQAVLAARKRR